MISSNTFHISIRYCLLILVTLLATNTTISAHAKGKQTSFHELIAKLKTHQDAYERGFAACDLAKLGDKRAGQFLLEALEDKDSSVRVRALIALKVLSKKGHIPGLTTALLKTLDSTNHLPPEGMDIYRKAHNLLIKTSSEKDIEALVKALDIYDKSVVLIIHSFSVINSKRSKAAVVAALKHKNPKVRSLSAIALGGFRDEEVTTALLKTVTDHNAKVRSAAIRALGYRKDKNIRNSIMKTLDDPNTIVRVAAVKALGKHKDPIILNLLTKALRDKQATVRISAAITIADKFNEYRAIPTLLEAIRYDKGNRHDSLESLLKLQGAEAFPALIAILKSKDAELKKEIFENLMALELPQASQFLAKALRDKNVGFRRDVVRGIRFLLLYKNEKDKVMITKVHMDLINTLIEIFSDKDPHIRSSASFILGSLKDKRAIPLLQAAQKSKNLNIRKAANNALQRYSQRFAGRSDTLWFSPSCRRADRLKQYNFMSSPFPIFRLYELYKQNRVISESNVFP